MASCSSLAASGDLPPRLRRTTRAKARKKGQSPRLKTSVPKLMEASVSSATSRLAQRKARDCSVLPPAAAVGSSTPASNSGSLRRRAPASSAEAACSERRRAPALHFSASLAEALCSVNQQAGLYSAVHSPYSAERTQYSSNLQRQRRKKARKKRKTRTPTSAKEKAVRPHLSPVINSPLVRLRSPPNYPSSQGRLRKALTRSSST